ncbi:hypothetical protein ACJMK2_011826 [Sinanodonta woodiana]|uniref:Uncharacterized protein n=1 Tax=Sinanodonta woodiana TaxID=1069815 RepID=A0ABD3V7X3_SINWO
MDGERYFPLANEYKLGLLREAKRWYMDGIIKENHYIIFVIGKPFRQQGQIMSIHGFIERNGAQKQLPLVFCLMSRKTKSDSAGRPYVKAFFLSTCYIPITFPSCLLDRYMLDRKKQKLKTKTKHFV